MENETKLTDETANNAKANVSGSLPDLDGREFYDLMQCYRIAPMSDQALVIRCFENVKEYLRANLR